MKSKVIRVCSLVLLSVAVSTALVGCGSKSEKDTAASSTTSTSKVMKSSAKTKTSEKKSAKKSKTEASSSKDSQGQEEASAPGASSSKIKPQLEMMLKQGQMVVLLLSQTSLVKQQLIPKVTLLSQQTLVGTWTGTSPQATDISFTVDADGNITSKANFNVDYEPYRQSSTTAKAVQISGNLYVWEGGDFSTLLPGITGIGGAGFQAKPGFILENGTYTPVQFISDLGPTFDYSNYNAFPFSLTK